MNNFADDDHEDYDDFQPKISSEVHGEPLPVPKATYLKLMKVLRTLLWATLMCL